MSKASLDAVFEELGLTAKWEAKGREKGLQEGREESRQALEGKDRALEAVRRENEALRLKLRNQ
jgi:hypothetical protein